LSDLASWLERLFGVPPRDLALYERALTHPSYGPDNYQRLEFVGDRVLGLAMAEWLAERFPKDKEGALSHRFTILVSGAACAEVGRTIGIKPYMRLGKQAADDGGFDRDNIIGDMVEALLAAAWMEHGFEVARNFVRAHWRIDAGGGAAAVRHPKSLLHEWAAAHGRKEPVYKILERSGPDHAPRFRVLASVGSAGEAEGEGASLRTAESAAASALLESLK
jgi:ribonuclease III